MIESTMTTTRFFKPLIISCLLYFILQFLTIQALSFENIVPEVGNSIDSSFASIESDDQSSILSINSINSMNSDNSMNSINSINPINSMNPINSINSINHIQNTIDFNNQLYFSFIKKDNCIVSLNEKNNCQHYHRVCIFHVSIGRFLYMKNDVTNIIY